MTLLVSLDEGIRLVISPWVHFLQSEVVWERWYLLVQTFSDEARLQMGRFIYGEKCGVGDIAGVPPGKLCGLC
jgi:hypothetical protein